MKVVYALDTVSVNSPRGFPVMVRLGTHWPATDAIVRDNPALFSDDPMIGISSSEPITAEVEQMTAAPGERRLARRPD